MRNIEPKKANKKDAVASLAGQIPHLNSRDRASLRRMDLTRSIAADSIIIQMLVKAEVDVETLRENEMEAWRTTAFAAALISGTSGNTAHDPRKRLGRALKRANYSQTRMEHLASREDAVLLRRALRFLVGAGSGPFDLREVYALVGPDQRARGRAVHSLMTSYYSTKAEVSEDN